jgi:hypothetical protein
MQRFIICSCLLFLFPTSSPAQNPDAEWNKFWPAFSAAVTKRDRAVLRGMMTPTIDTNGGGSLPRDQWLKSMTPAEWAALQKSVATGSKPFGRLERVTKDQQLQCPMFKLGKDGRWRWYAILGD